ncbi:MAG: SlyX family protein [Planctomycetota bacterium]
MRTPLVAAAVLGASAVALGAYAAHGLEKRIAASIDDPADVARRVENFATGARYQLATAATFLAIALRDRGRFVGIAFRWSGGLLAVGTVVFSGCLYGLAFAGPDLRWLGAVVPVGGGAMIAGWATLAFAAIASPPPAGSPTPSSTSDRTAERVTRLEELAAFEQQTIDDLNATVTAVRDEMDRTHRTVDALTESLRRLAETQRASETPGDEKPPHY